MKLIKLITIQNETVYVAQDNIALAEPTKKDTYHITLKYPAGYLLHVHDAEFVKLLGILNEADTAA